VISARQLRCALASHGSDIAIRSRRLEASARSKLEMKELRQRVPFLVVPTQVNGPSGSTPRRVRGFQRAAMVIAIFAVVKLELDDIILESIVICDFEEGHIYIYMIPKIRWLPSFHSLTSSPFHCGHATPYNSPHGMNYRRLWPC